jgi:hypothetical protein
VLKKQKREKVLQKKTFGWLSSLKKEKKEFQKKYR